MGRERERKKRHSQNQKNDTDLKVQMHRVNESSIIDGTNSNEHVIYLLEQTE